MQILNSELLYVTSTLHEMKQLHLKHVLCIGILILFSLLKGHSLLLERSKIHITRTKAAKVLY